MTKPIHESRLVRRTDPRTSVEAARRAAKASLPALQAVERLMKDGAGRIDEEIWHGCRAQGYLRSLSTIQHGRLALSESGVLIDSGTERNTSDNSPAIVWKLNPHFGANSPRRSPHSTESSKRCVRAIERIVEASSRLKKRWSANGDLEELLAEFENAYAAIKNELTKVLAGNSRYKAVIGPKKLDSSKVFGRTRR